MGVYEKRRCTGFEYPPVDIRLSTKNLMVWSFFESLVTEMIITCTRPWENRTQPTSHQLRIGDNPGKSQQMVMILCMIPGRVSWDCILDNTKHSKTVRQSVSHNTTVPVQEISISINETETLTPILFKPTQCLSHVWPQMLNWAIKFVHWSLCALSHRSIVWSYFNLFNFGFSFWDRREKRFYSFECSSWDPKYLGYGGPSAWGISIWYRSPALESHTVVNILLSRHSVSIFDTCIYGSITLWIGSRDLRSKIASGLFRVSTSVFISILTFSGTVL